MHSSQITGELSKTYDYYFQANTICMASGKFFFSPIGGGLGGTRRGGADVNVRHSGREDGGGRRSRSRDRGMDGGGFGGGSRRRSRCDTRVGLSCFFILF